MNKIISLIALLAVLILVVGCEQQAQEQQQAPNQKQTQAQASQETPAAAQQEQESPEFKMNMLYSYEKISEFEYKITSSAAGQENVINMKYKISSDTVNGKAAWLQQSDIDVQGSTATSKIWLDKLSLACLKISTVMDVAGQTIQSEGQCPTEGPN